MLPLVALLALLLPARAFGSAADVIRDCAQDGKLDKHYSQKELRRAQRELPSDIDEYTDCRDVIRAALQGAGGGGAGGGSAAGGNAALATPSGAQAHSPEDLKALQDLTYAAQHHGRPPSIDINGHHVVAGTAGLFDNVASAGNDLPWPLLLVLAVVGVLGAAAAYLGLRGRIAALGRVALRLIGR